MWKGNQFLLISSIHRVTHTLVRNPVQRDNREMTWYCEYYGQNISMVICTTNKTNQWSSVLQTEHTNGHLYYIQNIAMIICNTNRTYQWSPVLQTEHSNGHPYYKQNISMVICKTNVLGLLAKSWYWLLLLFSKKYTSGTTTIIDWRYTLYSKILRYTIIDRYTTH